MNDILKNRKGLPTDQWSYKLGGQAQYGLDFAFSGDLDIDEARMAVVVPFADGARRDSVGDLLEVGGIDTSRHRKNPVVLLDHGKICAIPIALAEDPDTQAYTVEIDPLAKTARAKAFFYQGSRPIDGQTPAYEHSLLCEQIFDMIAKRFIRAGSIGYQVVKAMPLPADYMSGTPQGLHLLQTLLLEVSAVVMPANQDTVRKALSMPRICGKPLSPMLVKSLSAYAPPRKAMLGYERKAQFTIRPSSARDADDTNHGRVTVELRDFDTDAPMGRQTLVGSAENPITSTRDREGRVSKVALDLAAQSLQDDGHEVGVDRSNGKMFGPQPEQVILRRADKVERALRDAQMPGLEDDEEVLVLEHIREDGNHFPKVPGRDSGSAWADAGRARAHFQDVRALGESRTQRIDATKRLASVRARYKGVKAKEQIPGGRAAGRDPAGFDQGQLRAGAAEERREHTTGRGRAADAAAREIAMDHLADDPNYYASEKGISPLSRTDIPPARWKPGVGAEKAYRSGTYERMDKVRLERANQEAGIQRGDPRASQGITYTYEDQITGDDGETIWTDQEGPRTAYDLAEVRQDMVNHYGPGDHTLDMHDVTPVRLPEPVSEVPGQARRSTNNYTPTRYLADGSIDYANSGRAIYEPGDAPPKRLKSARDAAKAVDDPRNHLHQHPATQVLLNGVLASGQIAGGVPVTPVLTLEAQGQLPGHDELRFDREQGVDTSAGWDDDRHLRNVPQRGKTLKSIRAKYGRKATWDEQEAAQRQAAANQPTPEKPKARFRLRYELAGPPTGSRPPEQGGAAAAYRIISTDQIYDEPTTEDTYTSISGRQMLNQDRQTNRERQERGERDLYDIELGDYVPDAMNREMTPEQYQRLYGGQQDKALAEALTFLKSIEDADYLDDVKRMEAYHHGKMLDGVKMARRNHVVHVPDPAEPNDLSRGQFVVASEDDYFGRMYQDHPDARAARNERLPRAAELDPTGSRGVYSVTDPSDLDYARSTAHMFTQHEQNRKTPIDSRVVDPTAPSTPEEEDAFLDQLGQQMRQVPGHESDESRMEFRRNDSEAGGKTLGEKAIVFVRQPTGTSLTDQRWANEGMISDDGTRRRVEPNEFVAVEVPDSELNLPDDPEPEPDPDDYSIGTKSVYDEYEEEEGEPGPADPGDTPTAEDYGDADWGRYWRQSPDYGSNEIHRLHTDAESNQLGQEPPVHTLVMDVYRFPDSERRPLPPEPPLDEAKALLLALSRSKTFGLPHREAIKSLLDSCKALSRTKAAGPGGPSGEGQDAHDAYEGVIDLGYEGPNVIEWIDPVDEGIDWELNPDWQQKATWNDNPTNHDFTRGGTPQGANVIHYGDRDSAGHADAFDLEADYPVEGVGGGYPEDDRLGEAVEATFTPAEHYQHWQDGAVDRAVDRNLAATTEQLDREARAHGQARWDADLAAERQRQVAETNMDLTRPGGRAPKCLKSIRSKYRRTR